ncbi:MAG: hypothetical protein JWP15_833 [Alphaproteobacteria bacterium]|nr:hypothetical protein [Alphaproteobacteria bacterium]
MEAVHVVNLASATTGIRHPQARFVSTRHEMTATVLTLDPGPPLYGDQAHGRA